MRIIFANNFFSDYGGTEILLKNQAELLAKKNHEVMFFGTNKEPFLSLVNEYKNYFTQYTDFRNVTGADSIKYFLKMLYNTETRKKMEIMLSETKPDIVHCHNIFYYLTPSILNACKKFNVPVVMSLNDPRLMCPGGTMMLKNKVFCEKKPCLKGNPFNCIKNKCKDNNIKSSVAGSVEFLFNRLAGHYNYVSAFICPSRAVYNLAVKAGFKKSKLFIVKNFIADNYFEKNLSFENKGYFLYVGRLAPEKGLDYLIKAAVLLSEDIKIHIVGTGPDENRLRNKVSSIGLKNIEFKGYLKGEDLEKEFEGCTATILPCNWFEAFGMTIAESYSFAKPVIASKIGAIPEIVIEGKTGFLFNPGNFKQLASYILKLHAQKDLAGEIGLKAREYAEAYFNSKLHYEKLMKIYSGISTKN